MSDPLPALAGVVLLLALSAFFSGSETAMMAVNRYRLSYLAQRGDRAAARLRRLTAAPDRLISTVLVGSNFANTAAAALATWVAIGLAGERGPLYATVVMTAAILIFTDIAPKTLAARYPERVARWAAAPVALLVRVLHPLASVAVRMADALLLPWGKPHPESGQVSEEDIEGIIALGEEQRVIAREKRRMIHAILHLTETTIEDVMIPRTSVVAIEAGATPDQIIETVRRSGNTRFPVYEGTLDRIVGVLHSKDVFRYWGRLHELRLRDMLRKPLFVPESATVASLLREFQRHRQHLAVVVDEYGGVEGIVTLEDLLEEIVGEIEDEYDRPQPPPVVELPDGALVAQGSCPLSLLRHRYGLELRARESATLAGYLLELTGRIPARGERIRDGQATFVIEAAVRHRVDRVRILRAPRHRPPEGPVPEPDSGEA